MMTHNTSRHRQQCLQQITSSNRRALRWLNVCQVKWLLATVLLHSCVKDVALKPRACIILIKNLNISHGHCNGTRNIIMEMTPRVIKAEKLSANA
jgi:hypothetical protein